ncbi:MAG: ABC transporter substrate-binding protein [Candidatus Latescibacterota bacterium]|nr:ABC transporter substrate-binding protein [Candidatus Latescibacterota bacterium]
MKFATSVLFALTLLGAGCGPDNDEIRRDRTMILDCVDTQTCTGQIADYNSFNPYLPGTTSRIGYNFLYEPLYFFNAYVDEDPIPWIATGHEFNEDFTEVTVNIRKGVEWSDGKPWTAQDLVFTIQMLRENQPMLVFSTDLATWVDTAIAVDDHTAKISLTAPNPRFMFTYFTNNFDNGVPIVPKHIWEGKDAETFENFGIEKDWPVVSGPYRMILSVPEQRVWERRDDWWAKKIGFQELPKVEKLIYLPLMEEAKTVQTMIANQIDITRDMRPSNISTVVEQNPNVTTWTGREAPYGYLDWWPISLGFNALEEPFANKEVRWAINHAIDRDQLIEVGWLGSGEKALLPLPDFPAMRRYTDGIADLLERHNLDEHNMEKSAALMRGQDWEKDGEGFWVKDGQRCKVVFDIFDIFQDIAPVLSTQLRRAGFDAAFRKTPDAYTRMTQGTARSYIMGNGGSVRDPYFTLRLYHSRFVLPTGTATTYFWRWRNLRFDAIVDEMGQVTTGDPRLHELFRDAMEIWLDELPAIPLLQWYHRIPHNQTYWTNWPSQDRPYINSAYWHRTWLLVLLGLEPVS